MISTFTITLRGASVARLLQEMAALLCGSLGMSMAAAPSGSRSLETLLPSRFGTDLSRSMTLPQLAVNQFQRPNYVGNDCPADAGKYGFIGHIIGWLKLERTRIRSEVCWPSHALI
jgi:hypothetical protein